MDHKCVIRIESDGDGIFASINKTVGFPQEEYIKALRRLIKNEQINV
jgi:hypothetical protein